MALNLGPLNVLLNLKGERQFSQGAQRASDAVSSLSSKIAGLLTIGAVSRQFMEATRVFAEFERGMVRVGAVTNSLGTAAFAGLTERAQDLARTTEFTARQVGDAMGFMGMAGMSTNQIYDATPAVLQLASAGMIDVAKAADVVTNIMAGYGIQTEDLNDANNILVATFTGSNTSLESLGQSFKYAGSVAKNAGVEFKEAAAVIGLMGNAGIQADMAGTALRGAIIKLLDPTDQGAEIMRRYGINVKDSSGKLKSMVEIFRQFEPIAGDSAAMVEMFGLRAGPGLQAALSMGTEKLEALIAKIDGAGNIAERIAEAQLDTLDGKIKIMKSNFEALQIAIGGAFSDTTTSTVSNMAIVFGDLADAISGATGEMLTFGTEANATLRNLIRSFSLGLLEGVTPDETLTGAAGAGAAALAERAELDKKIAANQFSQQQHLQSVGRLNMDLVAQAAELAKQWQAVNERIVAAGRAMRKENAARLAGSKPPGAKPPGGGGGGGSVAALAEAFGYTDAMDAVRSVFEGFETGVLPAMTEFTASELETLAGVVGFTSEIIIEHGDAVAEATALVDQSYARLAAQANATAKEIENIAGGVLSGIRGDSLGASFGPQLGQTIGGALAGPVGAAVGTVVGEAFGPLLDVVTRTTNIFGPVVDGLNQLGVALFAPLVVAMGPTFERLGTFMTVVLVPIFESLGYVIGTVQWLFEEMWTAGQNFAIWLQNLTRDDQNKIPYLAGKSFEQFMDEVDEARRLALEALNDQTYEAAERFRELNEELTNIPMGVKRLRALQFNATRGSVAFPGRFNAPAFGA
jgi:TP901 family phage tail tape measure protein